MWKKNTAKSLDILIGASQTEQHKRQVNIFCENKMRDLITYYLPKIDNTFYDHLLRICKSDASRGKKSNIFSVCQT